MIIGNIFYRFVLTHYRLYAVLVLRKLSPVCLFSSQIGDNLRVYRGDVSFRCTESRRDVWRTVHHEKPCRRRGLQLLLPASPVNVPFDDHWLMKHCTSSSTRSSQAALTTATLFSYGVVDGVIRRLQSVLHAAARLISGIRCYEHSSLAADITAPSKLRWWCSTVLAADVRRTLVMCTLLYTLLLQYCSFATTISRPWWPCRLTRAVDSVWLLQFPRVRINNSEHTFTGSAKQKCNKIAFKSKTDHPQTGYTDTVFCSCNLDHYRPTDTHRDRRDRTPYHTAFAGSN